MRKKTAFLLITALLLSLGSPFFLNAAGPAEEPAPFENLAIPAELGKIQTYYHGTSDRWVIQIQDVHAQAAAQQNINAILDQLSRVYGIHTVGIEGTWLKSNLPQSWGLPSSREKQMLAQSLMEEDYVNGAVYTAIFSQDPLLLVGLEDEAVYRENGNIYLEFAKNKEKAAEKIGVLQKKIDSEKANAYNPEFLEFDNSLSVFREGKKAEKFLPQLMELAAKLEIASDDLQQIGTFQKALALEKSIEKEKLDGESKRLMKEFQYARLSFEELLKSGKVPADKISFYPNASRYLELMRMQETIQHRVFFQEIETAILRIKEKLARTTEEKQLDLRSEAFAAAKKIIMLQATPTELEVYKSSQGFIAQDIALVELEEPLKRGLSFYDAAQKRDEIFFQKIKNDSSLSGNVAVVTGGFHTEGLSRRLEDAGISYVVITPDLGKDSAPVNEVLYLTRLMENIAGRQALTDLPPQVLSDSRDQGFVAAVKRLKTDRSVELARDIYVSYQIGGEAENAQPLADAADFGTLSGDDKIKVVEEYREAQTSKAKITAIIRQSVLKELLKDPVAAALWSNEILANNANKIILINDTGEIFTDTEGRAMVVQPKGELASIVAQEKRKGRTGKPALVGVIDPDFTPTDKTLVLPAHPAALLLLRPILERNDTRLSPRDLETLDAVKLILEDFYRGRGILKSA